MLLVRPPFGDLPHRCPVPAALLDSAGRILVVNESFAAVVGRPAEALVGQGWSDLAGAAERDDVQARFESEVAARRGFQIERALETRSGVLRALVTIWPLTPPDEPGSAWLAQLTDVTADRLLRDTSREQAAALRLALEAGGMGTWHWNIRAATGHLSPELLALHQLDPHAPAPTLDAYLELVHPEDRERLRASIARGLETGAGHTEEYRVVLPDGTLRWLFGRGRVELDPEGRPLLLSGICMDISDRKRAEEELRARDERHRMFLANSTEGIWRFELGDGVPVQLDPEAQIDRFFAQAVLAECNDAMARMYGYERCEELEGARLGDLLDRAHPANRTYLRRFIESGYRLASEESHERDRHGAERIFRNSLVGFVEEHRLVRVWGTQTDVTEQRRAEERLRESETRFRRLADHAPVLIWMANAENEGTFFNQPWIEFTGAGLDAHLGAGWLDFVHPDDRGPAGRYCQQQVNQRLPFTMEFRLRRHDGEYRWVLDQGVPLFGPGGGFEGYIGACLDITPVKEAQERDAFLSRGSKLLASSLLVRDTLELLADLTIPHIADWCAIDLVTDDGRIERVTAAHANPQYVERVREMARRWPSALDDAEGIGRIVRTGSSALAAEITDEMLGASARDEQHLAFLRSLGLRSGISVPLIARDRVLGAISLAMAESGRRYGEADLRLAEELAQRAAMAVDNARLYEQAQAANRAKDDFLARLSHELRTPLNAVLGWTLLMRGSGDAARTSRGLDVIDRNARVLARLIEDLLDFSRNVRGGPRLDRTAVDLGELAREALTSVEPLATQKGLALRCDAPAGVVVHGDPARLQQVVWNLLTNAVKFTADGTVAVTIAQAGDRAELVVHDTGSGISPDVLAAIFDPFRQADPRGPGLGLGLAIARQITEAHGGTIAAESDGDGRGSRFRVRLPLAPRPVA